MMTCCEIKMTIIINIDYNSQIALNRKKSVMF